MENNYQESEEFLQSEEWIKFQEETGKKIFRLQRENISANIIEHKLPLVGNYFYIPHWPPARILNFKFSIFNELIDLAKREKAGWIRIDPGSNDILELIKNNVDYKISKAPHDMQPREILMLDITKPEEQLMAEMKQKTRYNIRLSTRNPQLITHASKDKRYVNDFLRLVKATAERKGIKFHPENYYRKMIETIDSDMLSLYVAEFNNKVIAANLVSFFGDTAVYLHGATDDEFRNVMAPYLLQWQAILDAKKSGLKRYDFGGVKINDKKQVTRDNKRVTSDKDWSGITKFKLGFSPNTKPIEFPGSYDIILSRWKYISYLFFQKIKSIFKI